MKQQDIKQKSKEDIERDLAAARAHLLDLRFRVAVGSHSRNHEIASVRRQIARLLTHLQKLSKTN